MGLLLGAMALLGLFLMWRIANGCAAALQERDGLSDARASAAAYKLALGAAAASLILVLVGWLLLRDPDKIESYRSVVPRRGIGSLGQAAAFGLLALVIALGYTRFRLGRLPVEKFLETPAFLKTAKHPMQSAEDSLEAYRRSKRAWARRVDEENLRKHGTRFPDD